MYETYLLSGLVCQYGRTAPQLIFFLIDGATITNPDFPPTINAVHFRQEILRLGSYWESGNDKTFGIK
jgi:hypothetical protein